MSNSSALTEQQEKRVAKSQSGGAKSPKREQFYFRLREDVVAQLDAPFHLMSMAGISVRRPELREKIILLGLEHINEIFAEYGYSPPEEAQEVAARKATAADDLLEGLREIPE